MTRSLFHWVLFDPCIARMGLRETGGVRVCMDDGGSGYSLQTDRRPLSLVLCRIDPTLAGILGARCIRAIDLHALHWLRN